MAKTPINRKATKKATIEVFVKTAGKVVEKIDNILTNMVFDAFPSRNYVRHVRSGVTVSAGDGDSYEYTYVFEVDESYYRISHVWGTGMYTISPDKDDNNISASISLTAKSIREMVEMFEREEKPKERKYEFTGETKEVDGHTLHRIRAVRKITDPNVLCWVVNKGELGGWIESEKNLSHDDSAWVADEACVYGDAEVRDDANVCYQAQVYGNAEVYGSAEVRDRAKVCGHAKVFDCAEVFGDAKVFDSAKVYNDADVFGNAKVYDDASIGGDTQLCTDAPEEPAETETEGTLKHHLDVLEGRVDKLASEMKSVIKVIKAIKLKLKM